jgi:GDP-L-fucose synthase
VVFALENTLPDYLYNVGTGEDLTIKQLAHTKITDTREKSFGIAVNPMVHRKLMDISKMHWDGNTSTIRRRIQKTYDWFVANIQNVKK